MAESISVRIPSTLLHEQGTRPTAPNVGTACCHIQENRTHPLSAVRWKPRRSMVPIVRVLQARINTMKSIVRGFHRGVNKQLLLRTQAGRKKHTQRESSRMRLALLKPSQHPATHIPTGGQIALSWHVFMTSLEHSRPWNHDTGIPKHLERNRQQT